MFNWLKELFFPTRKLHIKIVKITGYGWHDNDPPGDEIAYPIIHKKAGGIGSYEDPITFAANPNVFDPGTTIYVPNLHRYFIMEDVCGTALHRKDSELPLIDIWVGGTANSSVHKLTEREMHYTTENASVFINPHDGYVVNTEPLFTD